MLIDLKFKEMIFLFQPEIKYNPKPEDNTSVDD